MRTTWPLALSLIAISLVGCSNGKTAKSPVATKQPLKLYSSDVSPIDRLYQSHLFIGRLNTGARFRVLNNANKLYVGDDADRALEVFSKPTKSYDVTDLPPGWKEQGYQADGWEASSESFGVVLQKGRVALVLFSVEHADERLFDSLVADYADDLPGLPRKVPGKKAKYAFWLDDDQTLMVCGTNTSRAGYVVTVAMGARPLMNALRMSEDAAKQDAANRVGS